MWGMAEEPFWPLAKGSSTSRNSLFWSARISVANLSMEVAMSASVAMYWAWRSRWRVWVEIGAALVPSLPQTYSSMKGSMLA
ncbi:hypothetical protein D3C76_1665590 [compost metagenome]